MCVLCLCVLCVRVCVCVCVCVCVYMLNKLKEEFFISNAATDVSSLVNLNTVLQLKIQAVTLNSTLISWYDWGAL